MAGFLSQSSFLQQLPQRRFSVRLLFISSLSMFTLLGSFSSITAKASSVPTANLQAQSIRRSEACVTAVYQNDVEAIETCQQAITLTQFTGDRRLEAYSFGNLGTLQLQQQHYTEALALYSQALKVAQSIADPTLEVKAWVAIGTTYTHLNQLQEARSAYQQALTVAQLHQDQVAVAVVHYNLGLIEEQLGNDAAAIEAYRMAKQTAQAVDDVFLEVYAANKLQIATEWHLQIGQTPSLGRFTPSGN